MKTTRKHPAATRHFGTRTLCLLMSLVMALSLVQVSVFATGTPPQVMSGNYVLNTDGTISTDGSGNAVTATPASTQDGYTLTKTAAANSSRGENWFDVTVQVGTTQTITTSDAAVVLVIDTSVRWPTAPYAEEVTHTVTLVRILVASTRNRAVWRLLSTRQRPLSKT